MQRNIGNKEQRQNEIDKLYQTRANLRLKYAAIQISPKLRMYY